MNKVVKGLMWDKTKVRIASFFLFWVGVVVCIMGIQYKIDIFIQLGLLVLVLSFFFFEHANYHLGVLKGYDKGYTDALKGNNYFVLYSPEDV